MKIRFAVRAAVAACLVSLPLVLSLSKDAAAQGESTAVTTPAGATHGSLVSNDLPKATGPNTLADSGIAANNVARLGANTFTGLQSLLAGVVLPSPTNPTGSNLYVDSNGALHFVNANGDFQGMGAKFAGDASRGWFTSPVGIGITETTSGQAPNFQINRNDKFNGGSGLTFAQRIIYTQGNGVSSKTTASFAAGVSTITVTPNANFAALQPIYGAGIPTGTTISSYSAGAIVLSNPLAVSIQSGTEVSALIGSTGTSPTNQPVGMESEVDQYSNQTSTVAAPNALEGFLFKWVPSTAISEGANILCRDWTGRKSSIAGPCIADEEDVVASGPDDNLARYILELTGAEGEPSADGATDIYAAIRIRPQAAESQASPSPVTFDNGVLVTTMPGGAANGVYGSFLHGFNCGGGETIGCHDVISETLTHNMSASAPSAQNQLQFALGTSINSTQLVTGSANIPAGTTVSAVYQCDAVNQLSGCGAITNATLVVLSSNLTGTIGSGTTLTFTGTLNDGSKFNAIFTDAFANWVNQLAGGAIKAGTLLNANATTVLDLCSQGEDSTSSEICYSDIKTTITSNTHGSAVGAVNIVAAGGGAVQANGTTIATAANSLSFFAATTSAQLASVLSDETGSGAAVFATSPSFTTPILGVATASSINKVAFTTPASGSTLTIADGKTLTASNTLTLAGTDGSTLNVGAGGTLGFNAFTSTTFAPAASPTFTGTVNFPDGTTASSSGFTMGAAIAMGIHGLTGTGTIIANNSSSFELFGSSAASATVPTLVPNRASTTTGVGAQASGNLSLIAGGAEIARVSSSGIILESGAYFSGATTGVTCSGSPTGSFASTNGIVTHC